MGFQYRTFKTCAFAFWPVASSDTHKQLSDTAELTQCPESTWSTWSAVGNRSTGPENYTEELGTPTKELYARAPDFSGLGPSQCVWCSNPVEPR